MCVLSGVPYHHLLFNDTREPLVEVCSQLLAVCFEKQGDEKIPESIDDDGNKFLFLVNRLHREEDFQFIIKGTDRVLMIGSLMIAWLLLKLLLEL